MHLLCQYPINVQGAPLQLHTAQSHHFYTRLLISSVILNDAYKIIFHCMSFLRWILNATKETCIQASGYHQFQHFGIDRNLKLENHFKN